MLARKTGGEDGNGGCGCGGKCVAMSKLSVENGGASLVVCRGCSLLVVEKNAFKLFFSVTFKLKAL
jgi:hypothetical protein